MKYKLTEFELNKRCAEIMGFTCIEGAWFTEDDREIPCVGYTGAGDMTGYDPCSNPADCWPIIEKYWDELQDPYCSWKGTETCTYWNELMQEHKCTKLQAACICLAECHEW